MLELPTEEVRERGHWSKAVAFEKFDHKEILIDDKKFQDSVFGKLWREVVPTLVRNFVKWNLELFQGRVTPFWIIQIFMNKIEANDLILPPTTPINVVKLVILSFRLRLLWFQRLWWRKSIFIVIILVNICKTLDFIIFPIWLEITWISFTKLANWQ